MNFDSTSACVGSLIPHGYYVPHDLFERVLALLIRRVTKPNPFRARGALLVAAPDNGKSVLLRALIASLDESVYEDRSPDSITSVYFDAPVGATWRTLFLSIGERIGIPLPQRGRSDIFLPRIVKGLKERDTKVIVVDELNNLVSGPIKSQHQVLEFLRTLSNHLGIPVIAAGTLRALSAVELDSQYLSRWPPIRLPEWPLNREYLALLKELEEEMGLPGGSFSCREHAPLVWLQSHGLVGPTVRVLNNTLELANACGSSVITPELIRRAELAEQPCLDIPEEVVS